ncbi:MAG: HU family DNA-binding protein [Cyanobacteria bacterium P01_F01_bin.42]
MNKGELVSVIADKASVTKKEAELILDATLDTIIESVSNGDKISLVGFGSFEKRHRKARDGRNPQTGQTIKIPATDVPGFSAGKSFKERVAA